MTQTEAFNPYDAPESESDSTSVEPSSSAISTSDASLGKTVCIWTIVCSVSAIPGFIWGHQVTEGSQDLGMVLGVAIFIVFYVAADFLTRPMRFRRDKLLRRTLLIGYWTRIVISVIFPIGMAIDVFAGMLSVPLSGMMLRPVQSNLLQVTYTTVVTGVVINIFLTGYMCLVYAVGWVFSGRRASKIPDNENTYR